MAHEVLDEVAFRLAGAETPRRSLGSIVNRGWRVLATGAAFAAFMLAALVTASTVFPIIRILPGAPGVKGRRVRRVIERSFAVFLRTCTALGLIRPVQVVGAECLPTAGPYIIVANHPTLFDIVVLGSLIRDFNCVVKHELLSHAFLRGCVKAAEYVTNERPQEIVRRCLEGSKKRQPLIIFPEGTRSPEHSLGSFSRGAAHLALRSGVPLVTAVLQCDPPAFTKCQKWFSVPERPIQFTVRFSRQSTRSDEIASADSLSKQAHLLTERMEEFFRDELNFPERKAEGYRPAILIPNHNHKDTIVPLLDRLAVHGMACLIVDDGSEAATERVLEEQAAERDWVHLLRRPQQGGKGAAVLDGLYYLHRAGFTHAVQLDADGQHDSGDVEKFLRESRANPAALVLGKPTYGPEVPKLRLAGRQISRALVWLETFSFAIGDPLLGYRVYPLQAAVELASRRPLGKRMDFDPEIAVRLSWNGVPVRNVSTRVSYPADGFSNFRMVADNLSMISLHLRLLGEMVRRPLGGVSRANL